MATTTIHLHATPDTTMHVHSTSTGATCLEIETEGARVVLFTPVEHIPADAKQAFARALLDAATAFMAAVDVSALHLADAA